MYKCIVLLEWPTHNLMAIHNCFMNHECCRNLYDLNCMFSYHLTPEVVLGVDLHAFFLSKKSCFHTIDIVQINVKQSPCKIVLSPPLFPMRLGWSGNNAE